jgi:hypothetical protein
MSQRVYVVVTLDDEGAITDLEVLDQAPRWNLEENNQWCYEASINGGDSIRLSL